MSQKKKNGKVWSSVAIDYSAGTDIYDYETKTYYTEEEARAQPPEIRCRLVNKPRKIGCWVNDIPKMENKQEK